MLSKRMLALCLRTVVFAAAALPAALLATGCGRKSGVPPEDEGHARAPAATAGPGDEATDEEAAPALEPTKGPAAPAAAKSPGAAGPVRIPAVAGSFYRGEPRELRAQIRGYLDAAKKARLPGRLVAVIAPHAGYDFSGPAAGWAYKLLEGADIESVVLVGGHSGQLPYAAVWASGAYRTPLGDYPVDSGLADALVSSSTVVRGDSRPHDVPMFAGPRGPRADHALEVHVPFLQVVLPRARLVPVYFNHPDTATAARVGAGIAKALRGRKAVIVCSTDLSHYRPAETAEAIDRGILAAIRTLDPAGIVEADARLMREHGGERGGSVCGLGAVLATVEAAKGLGATGAQVIRYDHSGNHVYKDRTRVVGYGVVAIYGAEGDAAVPSGRKLSDEERKALLALARRSLELALEGKAIPRPARMTPAFETKTGGFVTVNNRGRLRGCIGTFAREKPLWQVVAEYARQAAFHDPRPGLGNVTRAELPEIEIEISVLSPMRRLADPFEMRYGVDGLWVVGPRGERGTYLPQVSEHFRTKAEFIRSVCVEKAGIPAAVYDDPVRRAGIRFQAYTAEVFSEGGEAEEAKEKRE